MPAVPLDDVARPARSIAAGVGHVQRRSPRPCRPRRRSPRPTRVGVIAARGGHDVRALRRQLRARSPGRCRATRRSRAPRDPTDRSYVRSRRRRAVELRRAPRRARPRRSTLTTVHAAVDLPDQARQHRCRARPQHTCRDALGPSRVHDLLPAHRRRDLPDRAPRSSAARRASARRPRWRRPASRGSRTRKRAQLRREPLLRRLHQRAVERRADRQRNHALGAERLARARRRARPRRACPAITTWPGAFRFAGRHDLARRPPRAHACATAVGVEPEDRGHRALADRHRLLHVPPAAPHRSAAHRRSDSVPAATCAEYSPRLWPATNAGAHAARLEQPARRDAHRQDRRLRVLGQRAAGRLAPRSTARSATRRAPRRPPRTSRGRSETRRRAPAPCRPSAIPVRERRTQS